MVKDPFFWIKSLLKRNYELVVHSHKRNQIDNLLKSVTFEGITYDSIIHLWNNCMYSYLNPNKFSTDNTVIIRFEDFLYSFEEIMDRLSHYLIPKPSNIFKSPPINKASKQHGHKCNTRQEAIICYNESTKYDIFNKCQLRIINSQLNKKVLEILRYDIKITD